MGAGKSSLGREVAARLGRRFVDLDEEIERTGGSSIEELFENGEDAFRALEELVAERLLLADESLVIALGGGAVGSMRTREALRGYAVTILMDVGVDEAWSRVQGGGRPLARVFEDFRALYEQRKPFYEQAADAIARDVDDVVLAAAGILVEEGVFARLAEIVRGRVEVVIDERVLDLHPPPLEGPVHAVDAKTPAVCERLWRAMRLERGGRLVAIGGGSTTDVAGFVASTYVRGIDWIAVPTTLVGQVDAAIGGKTGIDLPEGKNLVGAFHWPGRTVIDPDLLATLPEAERRNGMAEVVKTGLLAGEQLWELPESELVRRCAAFKATICLRDPWDLGERRMLNLGHTFAHALEAASDYAVPHGEAVALGLIAALGLSGLDDEARQVEELLAPKRPHVDAERAWEALKRDKKAEGGRVRLVLLEASGKPLYRVTLPDADVRRALGKLIA